MKDSLAGLNIALPESRQLDVLAKLFSYRSANVIRCPLVSIHDNPNQNVVRKWLEEFIQNTPPYFVILTGEGIRRITKAASSFDLLDDWKLALSKTCMIARGPKPDRALREIDLKADMHGSAPTTDGIIETLETIELKDVSVSVQLYGQDPNEKLRLYLNQRGANAHYVAPYIYASDVETDKVVDLINRLSMGEIDILCFTSKAQYTRLKSVASKHNLDSDLREGMHKTQLACVGPVVGDQIQEEGYTVAVMPEDKYFMQPMVRCVEKMIQNQSDAH